MKRVVIIGSGFAGLSAACYLAAEGYDVTVLEKNAMPGGRACQWKSNGFSFDMGPSWYWMPEVFEQFFAHFGKKVSDYYKLTRLDPSYAIYFGAQDRIDVPASLEELEALFERIEPGSARHLRKFLEEAAYKYRVGMGEFVYKPSHSIWEFADMRILTSLIRLHMFSSLSSQVRKRFRNKRLRQLLEFPVLFLGATPEKTPALYSLMNYADLVLGTWYPMGGMYKIVEGMATLAQELGVKFHFNCPAKRILVSNGRATGVLTSSEEIVPADAVVGAADYHHVEQELLAPEQRQYSERYWQTRTLAPSSLLYYVGFNKRLKNLLHHTLFFDEDFGRHAREIYETPTWPERPLFYVSVPSITDPSVAPEGCENMTILIPVAPGLQDTVEIRQHYYDVAMRRLEHLTEQPIRDAVVYSRSFACSDFVEAYNSFKGNAYGLANTLWQTAFLKPKMRSAKVKNLFYAGQLTVPGPGVPPSIISGQIAASEIKKALV
ncbi:MAG: phytoene desaturase family protein [Saprospiraceae bacterium]|nr:phytoene desaturase family protein [Saprospiraceae bacterium]MDW8484657.1 phytoene desaturase family protein [Saprospiraceae bacterium]